ncbi:MAG: flippase-like domain-containing protein [Candidatus Marinimicrobia bacterium]|nr:flippase-like domain-containing protein [Candidatus Neomarinimicrobiota bacterium]MCF7829274.1 flippase-like domain-containing protein [Candidatus Neomarinimicrobiota bacterium]MCF7881073.1 flippase-like domain-containing protein [Candidatus Neomarinimicrobiota bacterium]
MKENIEGQAEQTSGKSKTPETATAVRSGRRWFWWILKLVVGIILLAIIINFVRKEENLWAGFLDADLRWIGLGLFGVLLHFFLFYVRWRFTLNTIFILSATPRQIWRSLFGGISLGLITPGSLGELARGIFFPREEFWRVSGASVIDKLYANLTSLFLGSIGILVLGMDVLSLSGSWNYLFVGLMAALIIAGIVFLLRPRILAASLRYLSRYLPDSISRKLSTFSEYLQRLGPGTSWKLVAVSVAINVGIFLELYCFLRAYTPAPFWQTFFAFEGSYLASTLLPLTLGNLGVHEGFRILFFSAVGVAAAPTLQASMIIFAVNVLIPAGVGFFFLPDGRRNFGIQRRTVPSQTVGRQR